MRLALTGATGFVGSHLAARLLREGHHVISLGRRPPAVSGCEHRSYDAASMEPPPLDDDVDGLIHLAAAVEVQDPPRPHELALNVGASWRLADWSRTNGVRHLHASSGGVYGTGPSPFREDDPLHPVDAYSITKVLAEQSVRSVNPSAAILRYFFPYGPGTPNPIPAMLAGALDGRPVQARSDGHPALNPIHITDAVEVTLQVLASDFTGALNIAGPEITTFGEMAELATRDGRLTAWQAVDSQNLHPYYRSDIVGDIALLEATFRPQWNVSLRDGIRSLVGGGQ